MIIFLKIKSKVCLLYNKYILVKLTSERTCQKNAKDERTAKAHKNPRKLRTKRKHKRRRQRELQHLPKAEQRTNSLLNPERTKNR